MSPKVRFNRLMPRHSFVDAFVIVSHRNISKLKQKFKGTADEWELVLSHFLLQQQPEGDGAKLLQNVRMVYALKGENIDITIQQDVKGIKESRTRSPRG